MSVCLSACIKSTRRRGRAMLLALGATLSTTVAPDAAHAQWSTTYETFYLQAPHNWVFRNNYQGADRLFNAFDYGHAILYETLWTKPDAPASALEEKIYNKLTREVLVRPPRVPLEEAAIEIKYAQLAPEAKVMFDWSHILHRQIYDVLADERIAQAAKDREVQRLIDYYKTRPDVAFSSKPKSMKLMQEQPFSLAFREKYPRFNGLIWGYHWLQVGLYEPLIVGTTPEARQAGVRATVARFWQMLEQPPTSLPYQMPMTAAVAPAFAARYPEAAIIFDNLHSMHDVVSDILTNPSVPRNRKRAEIMRAAARFRDDTSYVMPVAAWRTMSLAMGVENMGGPAVNFLTALPTPSVTRGAVMQHDDATGKMIGMKTGAMTGAMAGMDHSQMDMGTTPPVVPPAGAGKTPPVDHAAMGHGAPARDAVRDTANTDANSMGGAHAMPGMMDLHMRMLHDPGIRRRVMADTAMRRLMTESMATMPAEHQAMMADMLRADSLDANRVVPATTVPKKKTAAKAAKPAAPRKDPMTGMDHSRMAVPPRKK